MLKTRYAKCAHLAHTFSHSTVGVVSADFACHFYQHKYFYILVVFPWHACAARDTLIVQRLKGVCHSVNSLGGSVSICSNRLSTEIGFKGHKDEVKLNVF